MERYRRYAIYYTPPAGDFADFGASWLGWDPVAGRAVEQPAVPGLDLPALTAGPRGYGFHATLKAPFRLAAGVTPAGLREAVAALAASMAPVRLPGLRLSRIGSFLALTPEKNSVLLDNLAANLVTRLDPLRAPLTGAETARRQPGLLTARQRALLDRWGYPWVLEEFRFHMTLAGPLTEPETEVMERALRARLTAVPRPFTIDAISLMGEGDDGRFRLVARCGL